MTERDEKELEELAQRVDDARAFLHIDDKTAELEKLDAEIASPDFWNDAAHAQAVSKQASNLRDTIAEYDAAVSCLEDARAAFELAAEDASFAEEYVAQTA